MRLLIHGLEADFGDDDMVDFLAQYGVVSREPSDVSGSGVAVILKPYNGPFPKVVALQGDPGPRWSIGLWAAGWVLKKASHDLGVVLKRFLEMNNGQA